MYPDEVVGAAEVQLGEDGGTTEMFQGCWDERKGITELHSDVIQCLVIYTRPQAPVLFLRRKRIWKQQGTWKGGCTPVGEPPQCTPPWPSFLGVKVDKSFLWALTHPVADRSRSPMADEVEVVRLS